MMGTPHIVVARRPEHDFRIVQISPGFPMSEAVMEEARWLSLDWWGNCFARAFDGAVGHFRSTVEKNLFFLMLVLDGPLAPDRFVAFLREEEYASFAFDPFGALEKGLFSFADDFYSARKEKGMKPGWWKTGQANPPGEAGRGMVDVADRYLAEGGSILVPCYTEIPELRGEIMMCTQALAPATRMRISICSFTNAAHGQLTHFGPIFCGWYTTVWHRSLGDVLAELPHSTQGGSHEVR
jgi:hypothetical protein